MSVFNYELVSRPVTLVLTVMVVTVRRILVLRSLHCFLAEYFIVICNDINFYVNKLYYCTDTHGLFNLFSCV